MPCLPDKIICNLTCLEYLDKLKISNSLSKNFPLQLTQTLHTLHASQTICNSIDQEYVDKLKISTFLVISPSDQLEEMNIYTLGPLITLYEVDLP